jgi:hypothetical protein
MMNDPFVIMQAEHLAKLVLSQKGFNDEQRIQEIYMRTLSRNATHEEIEMAKKLLVKLNKLHVTDNNKDSKELDVWKDYCHSVFNLKEFIFLI